MTEAEKAHAYYVQHREQWQSVYYPRQRAKLVDPGVLAKKRESNKAFMRRTREDKVKLYQENKYMFFRQLGGKCEACGFADPRALQFDHIDPSKKTKNLTHFFRRRGLAAAFDELHNCRLLCANCHAIITHDSGRLRLGRAA